MFCNAGKCIYTIIKRYKEFGNPDSENLYTNRILHYP